MHSPTDLLVPERFDLAAKTLYARFRELGLTSDWGCWVYAHHLKVWNGFHEESPRKDSFENYRDAFHAILDAVKCNQFDFALAPIEINRSGTPHNGAHRLAAALVYGKEIPQSGIVPTDKRERRYTYDYFLAKRNIVPTGLEIAAADAMALEYCRLREARKDLYVVSVYPSAQGKEADVQDVLREHGRIVYRRELSLTKRGAIYLVYQLYSGEPWVGSPLDGLKGAQQKAEKCFAKPGPLRVYLVQASDPDKMITVKERIRAIFDIGKHSVHINNTYNETLHLARIFFNNNSIDFLNSAVLRPSLKRFWQLLDECAAALRSGSDSERICLAGSVPMGAFGLRDVGDFDYIRAHDFCRERIGQYIESDDKRMQFYHVTPDELLHDPRNHFHFHGLKFATLEVVREMKIRRWKEKDRRDVALMCEFEVNSFHGIGRPAPPVLVHAGWSPKHLLRRLRRWW